MRYRLELKLKPAEGALLRVLGMIERRGFPPHAVHATHDSEGYWALAIVIDSTRAPETLRQQLLKIYDVEELSFSAVQELSRDRRQQDRAA
ncbi:acetolactate synthase II small subunit [Pseudoxanthomonas japonensis]|uniref:ACT domain-containing protein n=1 Tax=Pseudoxanthomonas japonensis TaxID=69284 RepID=UPI001A504DA7|nr:ACT domain-containing protein [Pseudoxanthomonas japonensis]MBA3928174.1 acetolactate synthase [Xanthomonas sp.]MBL8256312.1 acetolactate synthase [Pseudoxanthomonas mexicana]MDR7068200.1 acetolactate synthase II small subunit [Pseudoxanthomonas japonensis]